MNEAQKKALVTLAKVLAIYWAELPIEVCNAWEGVENAIPDGEFREMLRGDSDSAKEAS